ncbi:MAG: LemA family protein [Bacilli bacterium]
MNYFIIFLFIVIVLGILLIWFISIYNKFQTYIIRINEAEVNIDSTLRKRFDLLNKSINIIKANTKEKSDVLEIIVKLRSRKLTNFELDRQLYEAINEFNHYKETYKDLKTCESFVKIDLGLMESESEIVAFRKYYNDIITDYNKLMRTFPSNVVGKLAGYKLKTYFDGKDMNDDIVNDFKL